MKGMITLLGLMVAVFCNAAQLKVSPDSGLNRISDAIIAAHPGDTIFVKHGVYSEGGIEIDKPLTLIGIDKPVIDGEFEAELVTVSADSVTIRGFVIQNVGVSYTEDWAGIKVDDGDYLTIVDNHLIRTFFGIYLKQVQHATIANNLLEGEARNEANSGNGIHLWSCSNIVIRNNTVRSHRDGIYFEFVEESTIEGNVSEDNIRYGLHFMFSNHDVYEHNTFQRNGTGVAVMFSKWITMRYNKFINNWGTATYGLLFKEIYDGQLEYNIFEQNTVGLYADGANRIDIRHNDFKDNGWAINMLGSSMDNQIERNNFVGNTFDLATNTSGNQNTYVSNYWDEYNGYDLDKDGYGDIPHRPIKLFSYVIGRVPESIILLRSLFVDMINFAEKVTPVLTPANLVDVQPSIKRIHHD
jgi:nitrous oxidase accessory protein